MSNPEQESYDYIDSLGGGGGTSHPVEDALSAGAGVAGWWVRHKENKQIAAGIPLTPRQQKQRKWANLGISWSIGYYLWWVPIAVYVGWDVLDGWHHITSVILTVLTFVVPFVIIKRRNKHRRLKLYGATQAPFLAAAMEPQPPPPSAPPSGPDPYAPPPLGPFDGGPGAEAAGTPEWMASAQARMRKNLGLDQPQARSITGGDVK